MKKVLLATSALVAFAGAAHAEMNISGYAWAGITSYSDDVLTNGVVSRAAGTEVESGLRMHFNAATETDSGLAFKVYARMIEQNNAGNTIDRTKVTVSSNGLSVAMGATNGAMRTLARTVASYGFNDGSNSLFDTAQSTQTDGAAAANILLTYSVDSFTVGVSANEDFSTTEIAGSFSANGFSVAAGIDDADQWMAKIGYAADGMSITLGANEQGDSVVVAGFSAGAATSVSVAMEDNAAGTAYGLQLTHDLGAGASLVADINNSATDVTVAGVGVVFNF
jgi:outer membrane protein OmpU